MRLKIALVFNNSKGADSMSSKKNDIFSKTPAEKKRILKTIRELDRETKGKENNDKK